MDGIDTNVASDHGDSLLVGSEFRVRKVSFE